MAKIAVNVTNGRELYDKFRRAGDTFKGLLKDDINAALNDGIEVAKSKARVRTGYMRDHIHSSQTSEWSYQMRSEATYSSYQDMGTKYMEGTHFMSEGAKTAREKAVNAIREDIRGLFR